MEISDDAPVLVDADSNIKEDVTVIEEAEDLSEDLSSYEVIDSSQTVDEGQITNNTIKSNIENSTPLKAIDNGTYAALQAKIDAAENGSTIYLENNYVNEESIPLKISKPITIDGKGFYVWEKAGNILEITSDNVTLKNIRFYGSSSADTTNAVIWIGNYGQLINCTLRSLYFDDNMMLLFGNNSYICNSTFYYSFGSSAGLRIIGNNNRIYRTQFHTLWTPYGAININGTNNTITNSAVYNVTHSHYAVYVNDTQCEIIGTDFVINNINYAVIKVDSDNLTLDNNYFVNNTVTGYGASIYNVGEGLTVNNSYFYNNRMNGDGSGVYSRGGNVTVVNSRFYYNVANDGIGGAVYVSRNNTLIDNCTFIGNSGHEKGGAVYSEGNIVINNCSFKNHESIIGGAIFVRGDGYLNVSNSNFYNSTAHYGGGAILSNGNITNIENCTFTLCSANYGGALSLWSPNIHNCTFTNNSALSYGGAILVVSGNITNSSFEGNDAKHGKSIVSLESSNITNCNVEDAENLDCYKNYSSYLTWNLIDYCVEAPNQGVYKGHIVDDLDVLYTRSGEYIGDKIKILIYLNYTGAFNLNKTSMQHIMNYFTDNYTRYYEPFQNEIEMVNSVYDSGFRVSNNGTYLLDNGRYMKLYFKSSINPKQVQNKILYNVQFIDANESVTKTTLNRTVYIGDLIEFNITVKNTGNIYPLEDVFICDNAFSNELTLAGWRNDTGNWTYNGEKWLLEGVLSPGQSKSIILIFKSDFNGTFTNNVTSGFKNYTLSNSSGNVTVKNKPYMAVLKISLTPKVTKGDLAKFLIVVKNLGKTDLEEVFVREVFPEDLIYKGFIDTSGKWSFDDVDKWSYSGILKAGESANFTVLFNTTKIGDFNNTIIGGSNTTNNTTSTNNTTVVKPKIVVTTITSNTTVSVGESTNVTVVIINDGDAPLNDIYVEQKIDNGFNYTNYTDETGLWVYDGISRWNYKGTLDVGESANFTINFVATSPGSPTVSFSVGSADEEVSSSENETFEVEDDTIEDDDEPEHPDKHHDKDKDKDKNKTPDNKNKTHPNKLGSPKKHSVKSYSNKTEEATGNPILALLLSLGLIILTIKRDKK